MNKEKVDEEFEHEFKSIKGIVGENTFKRMLLAWQAARAIDAKRIADLELENKQAKEAINILNDGKPLGEIVGLHTAQLQLIKIAELESEIARLNAIIEDMKVVDNVFSK